MAILSRDQGWDVSFRWRPNMKPRRRTSKVGYPWKETHLKIMRQNRENSEGRQVGVMASESSSALEGSKSRIYEGRQLKYWYYDTLYGSPTSKSRMTFSHNDAARVTRRQLPMESQNMTQSTLDDWHKPWTFETFSSLLNLFEKGQNLKFRATLQIKREFIAPFDDVIAGREIKAKLWEWRRSHFFFAKLKIVMSLSLICCQLWI